MFDSDLAALYGVTTKRLNERVGRNLKAATVRETLNLLENAGVRLLFRSNITRSFQ